ncbi:helix-turn-helix transcriptional regulator [Niallia sp. FSL W8-0951]|uniref:helix-turn-helix transcriptional regulator n=1 Tax=Niallia sp. FSL W8-0951 TaxID=2954639 RepID=UPI0030F90477
MRQWLIDLRIKKDLTQSEVAKQAEIARSTYAMIESGDRNASVTVAKKISQALDFDWIIFFED